MKRFILSVGLTLLLATGCSVFDPYPTGYSEHKEVVDNLKKDRTDQSAKKESLLEIVRGPYIGLTNELDSLDSFLPEAFFEEVSLVTTQNMGLHDIGRELNDITGYKVDVLSRLDATVVNDKFGSAMNLSYFSGTLQQLLDQVAANYGIYWEFLPEKETISFYFLKTRTFNLVASAGKVNASTVISNTSGGDSGATTTSGMPGGGVVTTDTSSSSEQKATFKNETEVWASVVDNIKQILSDYGKVYGNLATGTITVTDKMPILRLCQEYIDQINHKMGQQVAIEAKLYLLTMSKEKDFQFDLKAAFESTKGDFKTILSGAQTFDFPTGSGSLSATILESENDSHLSKWHNSELIANILNQNGTATLITSGSGITLNNQPMPLQNIKRTSYLAEIKSVTEDSGEDSTSYELTPGQVITGFSMMVTPHILDTGDIILQYSLDLSALDSMKEISSNEQSIQAPEVSTRSFMQRVKLKPGSTLLLAGFEQISESSDHEYGLTGFGKKGGQSKDITVVAITVNRI